MVAKTSGASPDKRRKYDEAFKAEALRLASESRSAQAAPRVGHQPQAALLLESIKKCGAVATNCFLA